MLRPLPSRTSPRDTPPAPTSKTSLSLDADRLLKTTETPREFHSRKVLSKMRLTKNISIKVKFNLTKLTWWTKLVSLKISPLSLWLNSLFTAFRRSNSAKVCTSPWIFPIRTLILPRPLQSLKIQFRAHQSRAVCPAHTKHWAKLPNLPPYRDPCLRSPWKLKQTPSTYQSCPLCRNRTDSQASYSPELTKRTLKTGLTSFSLSQTRKK